MSQRQLRSRWSLYRLYPKSLRRLSHQQGFTLIEVLAAIAILGVLMALLAPGLLSFRATNELNTAQDTVFQALRQAQIQATRSHLSWRVSFREVNGVVQWTIHTATTLPNASAWQSLRRGIHIDPLETTLSSSSTLYQVQFNHRGHVEGALGRLTLSIEGGGRKRRCVTVSSLLGALRKGRNQTRPDTSGKYCY